MINEAGAIRQNSIPSGWNTILWLPRNYRLKFQFRSSNKAIAGVNTPNKIGTNIVKHGGKMLKTERYAFQYGRFS
jgi:hypothetical protein